MTTNETVTPSEEELKDTSEKGEEEPTPGEDEAPQIENKIDSEADWKEELEREREAKKKAEKALATLRFKKSEERRSQEEPDNEAKPLTEERLQEILLEHEQVSSKRIMESEANLIAEKLATSPTEKALILEKWRNRVFPDHLSLEEQIDEAYALANAKRLKSQRDEALRALRGKDSVNTNPATTYINPENPTEPNIPAADKIALQQSGFTFNTSTRRYEKKLSNGTVLVRGSNGRITPEGAKKPIG